jgi:hypothetical protein
MRNLIPTKHIPSQSEAIYTGRVYIEPVMSLMMTDKSAQFISAIDKYHSVSRPCRQKRRDWKITIADKRATSFVTVKNPIWNDIFPGSLGNLAINQLGDQKYSV